MGGMRDLMREDIVERVIRKLEGFILPIMNDLDSGISIHIPGILNITTTDNIYIYIYNMNLQYKTTNILYTP